MISNTPLPSVLNLLNLSRRTVDVADIYRHADEDIFRFSRSAWAMSALTHAVGLIAEKEAPEVWLPDYFCNQSSEPIRRLGASVRFYPVTMALEPDYAACQQMTLTAPPDLFVLVHFYGREAGGEAARTFCNAAGAFLLEDAAHVMVPAGGIGRWGDATCYSPHKLFAVPDGSVLTVAKHKLARILESLPAGRSPNAMDWVARRLMQCGLPDRVRRTRIAQTLPELKADPAYVEMPSTPAPSRLGHRLLSSELVNTESIMKARRLNRAVYRKRLPELFGAEPLVSDLELPLYRDPYLFTDATSAERIYRSLRARGLPVESWPDLAQEVLANPAQHATAIRLRNSVITFPMHQSIDPTGLSELLAY